MSELKEILTESQLVKHYQVMQYLSKHPNETLSLAQLDYLLPRGASLQRFPDQWVEAMRDGAGSSRSVEVAESEVRAETSSFTPSDLVAQAAAYYAWRAQHVKLVCRRPEVTSLEDLSVVLQSPSTQLDAEACVAVHTDQILLSTTLLHDVQRAGLAYYFPDNYSRNDVRVHTVGATAAENASGRGGDATTDSLEEAAQTCVYPALPPGLHLHHDLFTIRGLRSSDHHSIPVRLTVGEHLFVMIDNAKAVEKRLGRQHEVPYLKVEHDVRVGSSSVAAESAECPLLVQIKHRTTTVATPASSVASHSPPPQTQSEAQAQAHRTKVVIRVSAVHAAPAVKLVLSFPNYYDTSGATLPPCVINMQVTDELVELPGVLIGRDRQPATFAIPDRILLHDALVNPAPIAGLDGDVNDEEEDGVVKEEDQALGERKGPSLAHLPLPWWTSSSPLVLTVRDAAFPSEKQMEAAVKRVFSDHAISAVTCQRMTRLDLQHTRDGASRRKRTRSRANMRLTNGHLIHFGLDMAMPFTPEGRN